MKNSIRLFIMRYEPIIYWLSFVGVILLVALLSGCKSVKYVPTETEKIIIKQDSIIERIDTQYIQLPYEVEKTLALPTETLYMSTKYAEAICYLDTNFEAIRGEIKNKDVKLPVEVKEVEKICYRDSVVNREVPVEVVVEKPYIPKWYKWMSCGLLVLVYFGYRKTIWNLIKKII